MIAIVDGGSTKCAWAILDNTLEVILETNTIGFNAYLTSQENLINELTKNKDLHSLKDKITHLFLYNSGSGTLESQNLFQGYLKAFFTRADIVVRGDLLGSCYALYDGESFIAGILGTGSNSCFFDGKEIHKHIPSLGYVLGDEGGGVALGKRLLKSFFYHQMPNDLKEKFIQEFNVDLHSVLKNIYSEPNANAYIGSFARFLSENREYSFCKKLVTDELEEFFKTQILPYQKKHHSSIVSLVGSITYYFEDEVREVANRYNLRIGKLIKNPLMDLVDYHKKYVIKNLK